MLARAGRLDRRIWARRSDIRGRGAPVAVRRSYFCDYSEGLATRNDLRPKVLFTHCRFPFGVSEIRGVNKRRNTLYPNKIVHPVPES
jgi:hypothetical protein